MNYFFKYKYYFIGICLISVLLLVMFFTNDKVYADTESLISSNSETEVALEHYETIFVDVKGAVSNAGVYEFKSGQLVMDAIEAAGGLTKNAVTTNINLSKKLKDEMVIYVYTKSEIKKLTTKTETTSVVSSEPESIIECENVVINDCMKDEEDIGSSAQDKNEIINLNTATLEQLMTLSGIGESKAKAIIAYRDENGKFNTIEEITNVSGIGASTFENIKYAITV